MQSARKTKLMIVLAILFGSAATVGLLVVAFNEGMNVYLTPTEIAAGKAGTAQNIRIGGMVKMGSLVKHEGTRIEFITTDFEVDIPTSYTGVLPDLFREGQGVVAEGHFDQSGVFQARTILAKHDENYMPPEVKHAMDSAAARKAAAEPQQ